MSQIVYEVQEEIGVLRVNRPEARNALSWEAQDAFAAAVRQAASDAKLRVLIVTGTGSHAFVSGGDLRQLAGDPQPEDGRRLQRTMTDALNRLQALPLPTIAAVNGDAIGGGAEILTACDLRLAAAHARIRFAQVQVGLSTGWGGGVRLIRLVGLGHGLDLLLTGRYVPPDEALRIGLLQEVVPEGEDLLARARALAHRLRRLPADALAGVKAMAYAAAGQPATVARQREEALFLSLYGSENHREALRAFLERRPPRFNQ
jgi:enoyl-CoA hydratase